jgi:16S rRNA processing protein RimM
MQEYLMIGAVLKPQGIRGEVKIRPYAARVEMFSSWDTLYLESRGVYSPVPCRVTRIHEGFVYAVLGNCCSADDAEKYRGRELFVDRAHAAPAEEGADYIADLIGCEAVDGAGNVLGTLTDVLQYGSVDTWVFKTPEGSLMAPALLAVFPRVETAARRIHVNAEKLREVAVLDR